MSGAGSVHPDPHGAQLQELVRRLDVLEVSGEALVYFDMPCVDDGGLSSGMRIVYGYQGFRVIAINNPAGPGQDCGRDGWRLFELALAAFAGTLLVDDPTVCNIVVDALFREGLACKSFTNGEDRRVVELMFR